VYRTWTPPENGLGWPVGEQRSCDREGRERATCLEAVIVRRGWDRDVIAQIAGESCFEAGSHHFVEGRSSGTGSSSGQVAAEAAASSRHRFPGQSWVSSSTSRVAPVAIPLAPPASHIFAARAQRPNQHRSHHRRVLAVRHCSAGTPCHRRRESRRAVLVFDEWVASL
jgi:hypothetical protein